MKRFEPPSRTLIEGVRTKPLRVIADERGRLMQMLRADDELFVRLVREINLPSEMYDHDHPDEFRLDAHDPKIPYDWARRDG